MILTSNKIKTEIQKGNIYCNPYNENNLAINSIDVTLNKKIATYIEMQYVYNRKAKKLELSPKITNEHKNVVLDAKKQNKVYFYEIPKDGIILEPNILYLGSTNEEIGSDIYVPMYEGRSSMARLGIQSHISAGFGDLGFKSNWTLEIMVSHKVIVYPDMRIGQVYFIKPMGDIEKIYNGKYVKQGNTPTASKSFEDFK